MYIPRHIEPAVRELSRTFPVVLVTGARQVGKTTLVRHLGEEGTSRAYVSMDEFGARTAAQEDPALLLQRYPAPAIIDEIQHAPELLGGIKTIVDSVGEMGMYWITGSQVFPMMKAASESLAGRVGILDLMGLSSAEQSGLDLSPAPFRPDRASPAPFLDVTRIFERIVRGSMPRLSHAAPPSLESFWGSYVQTYIERDVRSLQSISDLATFQRFVRVAAARVGQMINYSDIARDVGIAVSTAKDWIHLLEATHQVYLLRPYYENIGKRQIKTPKLYFTDTGLVCHLTGWKTARTASSGAMAGALFENHVVVEVMKSYRNRGLDAPLWYYRDKEKHEVDLLIAEDGLLFPIEVKVTASPTKRDLRGISALGRTRARLGMGALVCLAERIVPLVEGVDVVPVSSIR
jgi:hypothetical protein